MPKALGVSCVLSLLIGVMLARTMNEPGRGMPADRAAGGCLRSAVRICMHALMSASSCEASWRRTRPILPPARQPSPHVSRRSLPARLTGRRSRRDWGTARRTLQRARMIPPETGMPPTGVSLCYDTAGTEVPCDSAGVSWSGRLLPGGLPARGQVRGQRGRDHHGKPRHGSMWQNDPLELSMILGLPGKRPCSTARTSNSPAMLIGGCRTFASWQH